MRPGWYWGTRALARRASITSRSLGFTTRAMTSGRRRTTSQRESRLIASRRRNVIVLIFGSFFACLDPIAEAVGATWAIGTRPIVRGGRLPGEVITPMIGERKARAVSAVAGVRGVRLRDCAAYARSHGWPRLSAAAQNAGHPAPVTTP